MSKILRAMMMCMLLGMVQEAQATHLVGGEFQYSYIGTNGAGNKIYRIELFLYRDCKNGSSGALANDEVGSFGLWNFDSKDFYWRDSLNRVASAIVPTNFNNSCVSNAPTVCLSLMRFQFDLAIPDNNNGYMILYQRCCRNEAQNIDNQGGTSVGSTYFATINPGAGINSSAVFKNYPPQIICINNPLVYDNGAIDPDGDSLSYEFCDAYDIPAGVQDPNPMPNQLLGPDFFSTVPYLFGYTSSNPIPGNPSLAINAQTGVITGTPTTQGRFVVNVCCKEWRNGTLMNTVRRDFQFVITNCSKLVVANIPQLSEEFNTYIISCKSKTVNFQNSSSGGFDFHWDFGVSGTDLDTSNLFQPSFTYPDTGTYTVKLVVNRGSTCPDSIERLVKVYPEYRAGFSFAGLLCPGEPISFTDQSSGTLGGPIKWNWNFGDGNTATSANIVHVYDRNGGKFPVTLISRNAYGCSDTAIRTIDMSNVSIRTSEDTLVLANTPIQIYASGASILNWTPALYMDDATSPTPIFNFPDTGTYAYRVSGLTDQGCSGYDSIIFHVVNDVVFYVPNAFSPNGDGLNDYAKIIQAGYGKLDYFKIFDRWGNLVFGGSNFRQYWNGTYRGREAESGVYYWVIKASNIKNEQKLFKGDITLLR
jgi:gliding motility-associated-like protein